MAGTNLGTAYVQIVPSAQGISGSITGVLGGEAKAAGTSTGKSIASFAKKAIAAAGIGAALIKGLKSAIDEGAKLQQSYIGGLDTLYGDAADSARQYAREAAAAGISMNTYSEQAVSFGAALKAAYGGDTKKAADAANTAILDMADNSAKMGTSIESIQNAYQGFAKQNYTMLDNLKLGYGGTKKEMERLLADAQKISGVEYNIDNLGDVYEAIHVIQGEMGLTGVAAKEASETFSGSFNAMKASAQNLMGSLALGEDVVPAFTSLMESINTFVFHNLIPMIGNIVKSIPPLIVTYFRDMLPAMISKFVEFLSSITTRLSEGANSLTGEKVKLWAQETIPKILTAAGELIAKLAKGFIDNIPKIIAAIGKIGLSIVQGLGSALWPKITEAANGIKEKFLAPIRALMDKIREIVGKIKDFFKFNISFPHIKLPHFAINPKGWKFGDLLKGVIPKLGIEWHAKGGIADGANLIGIGEAGPEAILPLNPFWKKMDEMADRMQGNVTINVYGTPGMNINDLAEAVERRLVEAQKRRRYAW